MDTGEVTETGAKVLCWLSDYGALQVLAMLCILQWFISWIFLFYGVYRIGKPLRQIANWLEKHNKNKTEDK